MANKDQGSSDGMSRKQRRQAERAARKSGSSSSSSSSSGSSSGPSMFLISVGAVVIGLIAVAALVLLSGGLGDDGSSAEIAQAPADKIPAEELRDGRSLGDSNAPVVIEAYEDPQCPACGLFTERIEPLLVAGPVTDGEVYFTYKDFAFLGPESLDAAVAMRVAEDMDDAFWDYHAILFHNQSGENDGAFSRENLANMAEEIGLDRDEFLTLMDDPKYAAAAEAERIEGQEAGVSSTPSLIINGELSSGVPNWDELKSVIEAQVEAAA